MADDIDALSFASILAGVKKMKDAYNVEIGAGETSSDKRSDAEVQNPDISAPIATDEHPRAHQVPQPSTADEIPQPQAPVAQNVAVNPKERSHLSTTTAQITLRAPLHPPAVSRSTANRLPNNVQTYTQVQVANSQKGNPLLESPAMKLTPWVYSLQILSDYYINATLQVLFLSLKYHRLRPEYVWRRIEKLKGSLITNEKLSDDESLRVLLVVVDIDSPQEAIRQLLGICVKHDFLMVTAWSFEEAGNYVAYFKNNEMARSQINLSIQGMKKTDYNSNIVSALTTVRAVNKTDVVNIMARCRSFKEVVLQATLEGGLAGILGLGERKLDNLRSVCLDPFVFNKDW